MHKNHDQDIQAAIESAGCNRRLPGLHHAEIIADVQNAAWLDAG
jgi:hypothetical protein